MRKLLRNAGIYTVIPTGISFVILLIIQYGMQQGTMEGYPEYTSILLIITIIGHLIGWSAIGIAYLKI